MDQENSAPLINESGFAHRDMHGLDRWDTFTVSTTVSTVGALTTLGRYRIIGKECQFQAQISAATSIAVTSGVHYMNLPMTAKGLAGDAVMVNTSTNIAVGPCAIAVSTSRCYLPTQAPSAAVFAVAGRFEIGV